MFSLVIENDSDRLLVERLYTKYNLLMFQQANKILNDCQMSEDAVHEAFIRIINNLHKIDEIDCPRTRSFLVIICENIAKNIYNKKLYLNNQDGYIDEIDFESVDNSNNPLNIVIENESVNNIREKINQLNPIYRDIILLKKAYDFSNEEIVNLLGIPLETVKKRFYRAKKMLMEILEKECLK